MASEPEKEGRSLESEYIVADLPKFDLESYINNYEGHARLARLMHIGATSIPLRHEALRLAVEDAKQGKNVMLFKALSDFIQRTLPASETSALGIPDQQWLEGRVRAVREETNRLENELKGYKNNLIKESIRMGNEDLGAHHYLCGDYQAAQKAYSRMREYCTTSKHVTEMHIKLANVAIASENSIALQSSMTRVGQNLKPEDQTRIDPVVPPLMGLAHLAGRNYTEAAKCFLSTPVTYMNLEPIAGVNFLRTLTPNDIAVYGALTALAMYDRKRLQSSILDSSSSFRQFLELEPHLRRAVNDFCSSKYTACLRRLEAYRADYYLDVHMCHHVSELFTNIRRKCIVAYLIPYRTVSIADMARDFPISSVARQGQGEGAVNGDTPMHGTGSSPSSDPKADEKHMTTELEDLITKGFLPDARINLVTAELNIFTDDSRRRLLVSSIELSKEVNRSIRLRQFRANMIAAGKVIENPNSTAQAAGTMHQSQQQHPQPLKR